MGPKDNSRLTQIIERPAPLPLQAQGSTEIERLIEQGEEVKRIFMAIVEQAVKTPGIKAAAIILPADKLSGESEIYASSGNYDFKPLLAQEGKRSDNPATKTILTNSHKSNSGEVVFFDVVCVGSAIGSLAIVAPLGVERMADTRLRSLAHQVSVCYERLKISTALQACNDRLQVLTEINQLIASNVGLQRLIKSLVRESAFCFSADLSLIYLTNEDNSNLLLNGCYGGTPSVLPPIIELKENFFSQILKVGGQSSIHNLHNQPEQSLGFMDQLGMLAVYACSLEVRGGAMGVMLIGYRRELALSKNDLTRFEEFCQGAAVAIANAKNQERITAYSEHLQDLVQQRTAELALQTSRAEEASQAKSQFLANMSHELRTPLTAIVGYSSVLVDGVFGELSDKQRDALKAIAHSGEHLKNLIDDVLNLARIESGKEQPEPTRVPAREILLQACKLMQQSALSKGVTLSSLEIDPQLQTAAIWIDRKHIHQIVINLMSNAVKYTPKGGSVKIKAEKHNEQIKIIVSDTGVGISAEKMSRLFERFERGEDSYSRSQEGTGIGLNLTRHLVDLNSGKIGVESKPGSGSTFWVILPLAKTQIKTANLAQQEKQVLRLDGLSTVVIDDSKDTCEVLKQSLLAVGAQVRIANSVAEAINLISQSPPDIVLTDLAMPGANGLDLIAHVRGSDQTSKIPIIVLSACAFQADREAAINAGASAFIAKPFRPAEIIKNVERLVKQQLK